MLGAVVALLVLVASMGALAVVILRTMKKYDEEGKQQQQQQQQRRQQGQAQPQAPARPRDAAEEMRQNMRRRLQARQAAAAAPPNRAVAEGSASESGSEEDEGAQGAGVRNRRAARRAAADADREQADANKQTAFSAYEERRRQKDAEREAREAAQEEEIRRAAEEAQRRADEEAARWMKLISVEEQGVDADEDGSAGASLLDAFVTYIISRKMVPLEELAVEFGMRTSEVIDRIRALEEQGRLTGVMDDRGKYIYISLDEMKAVAQYIVQKGRVAISELAAKSASFIDLEVKAADASALAAGPCRPALDFDALLA